jgi:hypothetical protein
VNPCRADRSILKVIGCVFGPCLSGRDALIAAITAAGASEGAR